MTHAQARSAARRQSRATARGVFVIEDEDQPGAGEFFTMPACEYYHRPDIREEAVKEYYFDGELSESYP